MIPLAYDPERLGGLPLPEPAVTTRIKDLLGALVARRILPYFRRRRLVDAGLVARVSERHAIVRLEDPQARVRTLTVLTHALEGWTLFLHERFFDYLAFMLPGDPDLRLSDVEPAQRQAFALAELLLRHELEHMLFPGAEEGAVVGADLEFLLDRRDHDPTYHHALRDALADAASGILGAEYLDLLGRAERGEPTGDAVAAVVAGHVPRVAEVPAPLLVAAFAPMGSEFKARLLDECYRRSRSTDAALVRRLGWLHVTLHLLAEQVGRDREEAWALFQAFKERWGVTGLLHEIEVDDDGLAHRSDQELFDLLVVRLGELAPRPVARPGPGTARDRESSAAPAPRPSLSERIEVAREDPRVPRPVIDIIDKNRGNLPGVSGAKFTELIETLLLVPWGRIAPIAVTPAAFIAGMEASHFGLERPKELLADFFTNLIWRYRSFSADAAAAWHRTGSAFLLVGPPGVGKTSLAISVARSLGLPFHKLSLGGMRDESDLRGHGFTYEGSKPGAIVQGLVKMGAMNGMFIMDEADKTEAFAIATLLEILDPEQNHLFHDKYVSSTVDIDLSNCHFILTANTLETVPAPVLDRCEVVVLDRYSVDEKVAIAREYLIPRIRERHAVDDGVIGFAPDEEAELLRHLVTTYTREAGVRQLERVIRTLFLRLHRRHLEACERQPILVTHETIKNTLDEPAQPRRANPDDRIGEILGLGVNVERGIGSVLPVQATAIHLAGEESRTSLSMIHATGNLEKVMDESRKVASTAVLARASELGIDASGFSDSVHLHLMGASSRKDGPSAGSAIALALASLLSGRPVRRDVAVTGEIDTHGRITAIGGLEIKLEAAQEAGCRTVIIPRENLAGEEGIERFPATLKDELQVLGYDEWAGDHEPFDYRRHLLQVVAVDDVVQAATVALLDEGELAAARAAVRAHGARARAAFAAAPAGERPCVLVMYVKEADELHPRTFRSPLCRSCDGCRFVVVPAAAAQLRRRLPQPRRREANPVEAEGEDVAAAVRAAVEEAAAAPAGTQVAVVAPFFTHAKDATGAHSAGLGGARLFANNYAVQGVKLKGCKPLLTRAWCYLARLEPELLGACPFTAELDGVRVADLSFLPEKLRLDVGRAQQLLNDSIEAWLAEVETPAGTKAGKAPASPSARKAPPHKPATPRHRIKG